MFNSSNRRTASARSSAYQAIQSPNSPGGSSGPVQFGSNGSNVMPMSYMQPHEQSRRPIFMQCTDGCMYGFRSIWDRCREYTRKHEWPQWASGRILAMYFCGFLFSAAWWAFIDGVVYSNYMQFPVYVELVDWLPGLFATLSFFMMNMVDKDVLNATEYSYSGYGVAWKARLWFFIAIVLSMSSFGGSVAILAVKYYGTGHYGTEAYAAWATVFQTCAILISSVVMWAARNYEDSIHL